MQIEPAAGVTVAPRNERVGDLVRQGLEQVVQPRVRGDVDDALSGLMPASAKSPDLAAFVRRVTHVAAVLAQVREVAQGRAWPQTELTGADACERVDELEIYIVKVAHRLKYTTILR